MDADLRARLQEDLQKSGFHAEMRAIQTLRRAGWNCSGAGSYFDLDERITRTIDARAGKVLRNSEVDDGGVEFEYELFIEVKKSDRPWVVFRQTEEHPEVVGDAWDNPWVTHNLPIDMGEVTPLLRDNSIRRKLGWLGYGVHEAFKEPRDTGRWYSAAVTSCKAAYDYLRHEAFDKNLMPKMMGARSFLMITQPVVILDAPLISVELCNADFDLQDIPYAPLEFAFSTAHYDARQYRVDLVCLNALQKYLDEVQPRLEAIFRALYDAKRATRRQ